MSSLADLPEIIGFFSYSREDDEAFRGTLSAVRDAIQRELAAQLGRSKATFRLWQDKEAIAPGKLWESEIKVAVEQSVFFIPIVTPRMVNSRYCQFEFDAFLARERELGRTDLVFPILYLPVAALENEAKWRNDPVLSAIARRQYVDWQTFRYSDIHTPTMREEIARFARKIVETLNAPWVSPEERQAQEEKRRQQAEAERQRKALEEVEAECRVRAERQHQEAETARRAEEEQRHQQANANAQQNAEQAPTFAAVERDYVVAAADEARGAELANGIRSPTDIRPAREEVQRANDPANASTNTVLTTLRRSAQSSTTLLRTFGALLISGLLIFPLVFHFASFSFNYEIGLIFGAVHCAIGVSLILLWQRAHLAYEHPSHFEDITATKHREDLAFVITFFPFFMVYLGSFVVLLRKPAMFSLAKAERNSGSEGVQSDGRTH